MSSGHLRSGVTGVPPVFTDERGREKRMPLATDKGAPQAMLDEAF